MGEVPVVTLNNGIVMPQVGLGLAKVADADATSTVLAALEAGYRSIDTAKDYGNEPGVGRALRISAVPRQDLFITSKVWNADHGHAQALAAFDASLQRLGLEYLDLYLIHWPVPTRNLYLATWSALEELYAAGRARAIGVSNFEPAHLRRLLAHSTVTPAVNQIELHPRLQQKDLCALHQQLGVATEAWSPLAKGRTLMEPSITTLAKRRGITPAQLVLRWHMQLGHIVIPKTTSTARMRENLDAASVEPLEDREVMTFNELDTNDRIGPNPNNFE